LSEEKTTGLGFALGSLFSRRCQDDPDADVPSTHVTRKCEVAGCGETTREGKDYCTRHVEKHPYIQHLLNVIATKHTEDRQVELGDSFAVNPEGLTIKEIIIQLRQTGTKTLDGLSKALQLDKMIIQKYLFALQRQNKVELFMTQRDNIAVRLLHVSEDELFGDEDDDD